jgi:hypothetical protein
MTKIRKASRYANNRGVEHAGIVLEHVQPALPGPP